ncbi:MAG: RES family NAD+ phosphorylase [Candidatus Babeliales bacterium]
MNSYQSKLEEFSDYTISKEDQKWLNSISKNINKSIERYKSDLIDFEKYLWEYPSLGYKHRVGKMINKSINTGKFSEYCTLNTVYFKARKVESESVLFKKDFRNPPVGKSSGGRFNWGGQSVLYLSTTKDGACEEICETNKKTIIWVSRIKYNKGNSRILDLTLDPFNYEPPYNNLLLVAILNLGLLNKRTSKQNGNWKPEYLMTNYISDCCKEAGYNGLAYTSTKYYATNLVIFSDHIHNIEVLDKPDLICYKPDIEHRKMIKKFEK